MQAVIFMKTFISHSSKDKAFVRKLKNDLKLNYIDTWFDEDELEYGDSLLEKLTTALSKSSHFLIVLSPNSTSSDWVKYELENALKYIEEEVVDKIIPIYYRHCEMPEALKNILNIDLSHETVYLRHGELEIFGETYYRCLNRLVTVIKRRELELKEVDKNTLLSKNTIETFTEDNISYNFKIQGYKSISNFLANQIPSSVLDAYKKSNDIRNLIPVVLPKQLENQFPKIKFGDKVTFAKAKGKKMEGQFARFSSTNTLSIPEDMRKFLGIDIGSYKVVVNQQSKDISVGKLRDK